MTQFWQLCNNDPVAIILMFKNLRRQRRRAHGQGLLDSRKKPQTKTQEANQLPKASEKYMLMPAVRRGVAWDRERALQGRPAREVA